MASTEGDRAPAVIGEEAYRNLVRSGGFEARPLLEYCVDVFDQGLGVDYELSRTYHVVAAERDLPLLLSLQGVKLYVFSRCHHVTVKGDVKNEHWHGLMRFTSGTKRSCLLRLRKRVGSFSTGTRFHPVLCFDSVLDVYHKLSCKDRVGMHVCYNTSVAPSTLEHSAIPEILFKGGVTGCARVRHELIMSVKDFFKDRSVSSMWNLDDRDVLSYGLHVYDTCMCSNGKVGIELRERVDRKRNPHFNRDVGQLARKKRRTYHDDMSLCQ